MITHLHDATSTVYRLRGYRLRVTRFRLCGLPMVHECSEECLSSSPPSLRHRWYVDQGALENPAAWKQLGMARTYATLHALLAALDRAPG